MSQPDLDAYARDVLDTNFYLALGTVDPDGRPRVSPVFFTHVAYREIYWISSPDAHHSRNLASRPDAAAVVFDSTVPVGAGRAAYLDLTVETVPDDALPAACAAAFADGKGGVDDYPPEKLSSDADLRLFRARVTRVEVHVRGGDPVYGTGIDSRRAVDLATEAS